MIENLKWFQWVWPIAYLVGGFVAGVLFKRVVLARIEGFAATTQWEGDDIIVGVARRFSIPLFALAGVYLAFLHFPIALKIAPLIQKTLLVSAIFIITVALAQMIDVAREVLKEVQGGVPTFDPFIRYHTFADFSINFTVILRAKEFVDQYLIKHEFVKRLHERYQKEKIEIPFPIRTVHMKQT